MKSTRNITQNVMKRVVGVEKKVLHKTILVMSALFASLLIAFITVTVLFVQDIKDLGAFDALALFWEDREIISEYWIDVLSTFWVEVSSAYLYLLFGIVLVTCIIFYFSANKRKNISLRNKKLASYEKTSTILQRRTMHE